MSEVKLRTLPFAGLLKLLLQPRKARAKSARKKVTTYVVTGLRLPKEARTWGAERLARVPRAPVTALVDPQGEPGDILNAAAQFAQQLTAAPLPDGRWAFYALVWPGKVEALLRLYEEAYAAQLAADLQYVRRNEKGAAIASWDCPRRPGVVLYQRGKTVLHWVFPDGGGAPSMPVMPPEGHRWEVYALTPVRVLDLSTGRARVALQPPVPRGWRGAVHAAKHALKPQVRKVLEKPFALQDLDILHHEGEVYLALVVRVRQWPDVAVLTYRVAKAYPTLVGVVGLRIFRGGNIVLYGPHEDEFPDTLITRVCARFKQCQRAHTRGRKHPQA